MATSATRDPTLAGLAVAAVLLTAAPAARAADIPGGPTTGATLTVQSRTSTEGVFETTVDSDWYKVRLARGQDYAVRLNATRGPGPASSVAARDPRRRVIRTIPGDGLSDVGFELRATTTGTHFIDVSVRDPEEPVPLTYSVAVTPDCRDAASTRCRLEVGRAYNGLSAWFGDHDRFAVTLDNRHRYTFTVTSTSPGLGVGLELLDARGTVLREVFDVEEAAIGPFRPTASGKHFLRVNVNSDDFGGAYRALVTAR